MIFLVRFCKVDGQCSSLFLMGKGRTKGINAPKYFYKEAVDVLVAVIASYIRLGPLQL
jgi:hypothetical protein